MRLDVRLTEPLETVGAAARGYEELGYAGAWVAETKCDPFLPVLAAAQSTERIQIGTSIAVAFARSPMTVAMTANDLQRVSHGRFVLGLGTQVKGHIVRRYSMPWSAPAARMREYILALRAIWLAWNEDTPLEFRGTFYRHDLMTPFFRPDPNPYGAPKVFLAGVGPKMTEVAGAIADGFLCHAFTTEKYLRDVTVPALSQARLEAGGTIADFEINGSIFVVTGSDDAEIAAAARSTKRQIAFYASTPAYRGVLDVHGWAALQPELNSLARADRWTEMEDLISDEMLDAFAVVETPDKVAEELTKRLGDIVSRCNLYITGPTQPEVVESILREVVQR